MTYHDKRGHFTSEENNGGECSHNDLKIDVLKSARDIVEYAKKVLQGDITAPKAIVGYISEKERREIENLTKEPLNALYHSISRNEIIHIHNRHGENGKADQSMANINDYYKILDTIQNFDSIQFIYNKQGDIKTAVGYSNKYNNPAKLIQFKKELNEKNVYVVEAITDGKDKEIKIISAYQK